MFQQPQTQRIDLPTQVKNLTDQLSQRLIEKHDVDARSKMLDDEIKNIRAVLSGVQLTLQSQQAKQPEPPTPEQPKE